MSCACTGPHDPKRIVLTGGPGAGKTAVLELIRKAMCRHVRVVPEAAGIVFGGGFPRGTAIDERRAAQRAIFYVQRELEAVAAGDLAIALCDRGTIDGLAYWPGADDLFASVGTSLDEQLARYHAVIHLRTPAAENGYKRDNPLRIESVSEAAAIDAKIATAWERHPRRFEVPATPDFLVKATSAIAIIRAELPPCCRAHPIAAIGEFDPTEHELAGATPTSTRRRWLARASRPHDAREDRTGSQDLRESTQTLGSCDCSE